MVGIAPSRPAAKVEMLKAEGGGGSDEVLEGVVGGDEEDVGAVGVEEEPKSWKREERGTGDVGLAGAAGVLEDVGWAAPVVVMEHPPLGAKEWWGGGELRVLEAESAHPRTWSAPTLHSAPVSSLTQVKVRGCPLSDVSLT